jgi:hypothetical protein
MLYPQLNRRLKQHAALLEPELMYGPASETVWAQIARAQGATRSLVDLGSFKAARRS